MFDAATREELRAYLIEKARTDPHVVAAATVGGSAASSDRWSDLDLTFGVAYGVLAAVQPSCASASASPACW